MDTPKPANKSLRTLFRDAHKRIHVTGAVGLWLMLATIVVLLLGAGALGDDPSLKRILIVSTLLLIFFAVVIIRAFYDCVEIFTHHFREQEKVFRTTLGDTEFARELGERVQAERETE